MLTQLSTVKARLAIPEADATNDAVLTSAIKAVSARFDKETNRTLARTVGFSQEFPAADTEVSAACYPIESLTKFELKTTEAEGWQEQSPIPDFLIRKSCIISLAAPQRLVAPQLGGGGSVGGSLARATYTGGYVLPGDPDPQPTTLNSQPVRLPADLEQAAVEQVAYWFQKKDKLGLKTYWPSGAAYQQFADLDLLAPVAATLHQYRRWSL